MTPLNLFDVRYFLDAVEGGTLQAGAQRAHVTPAAMTKSLQRLEGALEVRLMSRSTRGARLTADGERMVGPLRALLAQADLVRDQAQAQGGRSLSGEIRILAMEVFSPFLLPRAISTLIGEHPALLPKTYESFPERMIELVASGRADVAFTVGRIDSHAVRVVRLGTTPGVLVCGRGHPLARRKEVDAAAVAAHPSVVPRFWGAEHLPSLDQFPDHRWPRRVGATIELLRMGVRLVEEGRFLGYFPEISIREELQARSLVRLPSPTTPPFDLVAILPATGARPAAETLAEGVRALLQDPPARVGTTRRRARTTEKGRRVNPASRSGAR